MADRYLSFLAIIYCMLCRVWLSEIRYFYLSVIPFMTFPCLPSSLTLCVILKTKEESSHHKKVLT